MTVSTRSQSKQSLFTSSNTHRIVTRSRSYNMKKKKYSRVELQAANALIQLNSTVHTETPTTVQAETPTTNHRYFTRLNSYY
jgi:hypothetical protein